MPLHDFVAIVRRRVSLQTCCIVWLCFARQWCSFEGRCSKTQQTPSTTWKRNSRWTKRIGEQCSNIETKFGSHWRNAAKLKRSPHQTNATKQCHVIETKFALKPSECRCLLWCLFGSRKRHPSSKHMLVPFRVFSRGLRKRDSRWVLLCCGAFFCNAASYKHRGCVALNHIRMRLKRVGRTGLKPFP